jgi:hypothetical protein
MTDVTFERFLAHGFAQIETGVTPSGDSWIHGDDGILRPIVKRIGAVRLIVRFEASRVCRLVDAAV